MYASCFLCTCLTKRVWFCTCERTFQAFSGGYVEKEDVGDKDDLNLAVDQQEQDIDELEEQLKELKRLIHET